MLFVEGEVLEVQVQEPYTNPVSGKTSRTTRVLLGPENPRCAAEFYDTPSELPLSGGELVRVRVAAQARLSKAGWGGCFTGATSLVGLCRRTPQLLAKL